MYLSMRSVMNIGGYCAEGGAYEIAVHCPKGIPAVMTLSIFGLLGFGFLYAANTLKSGPNVSIFFWTALFSSLGFNFFQFGIHPPEEMGETVWAWIFCGVVFWVMACGPVFLFSPKHTLEMFLGPLEKIRGNWFIIILHLLIVIGGVVGGPLLFNIFTR
jgi:hypothetical protein